jgi:hypothetical protein
MATQHIDLDKVSLVETFPYLHRDGSGKFKQDLLGGAAGEESRVRRAGAHLGG